MIMMPRLRSSLHPLHLLANSRQAGKQKITPLKRISNIMNYEEILNPPAGPGILERLNPLKNYNGEALVLHLQEFAPIFHIVWVVIPEAH
jgi:hypothetical protein